MVKVESLAPVFAEDSDNLLMGARIVLGALVSVESVMNIVIAEQVNPIRLVERVAQPIRVFGWTVTVAPGASK